MSSALLKILQFVVQCEANIDCVRKLVQASDVYLHLFESGVHNRQASRRESILFLNDSVADLAATLAKVTTIVCSCNVYVAVFSGSL